MPKKKQNAQKGQKILLIDNYQKENSKSVQQIESSLKSQGYNVDIIRHSDAKVKVEAGEDILDGYVASVSSGSGKS